MMQEILKILLNLGNGDLTGLKTLNSILRSIRGGGSITFYNDSSKSSWDSRFTLVKKSNFAFIVVFHLENPPFPFSPLSPKPVQ